MSIPFGGPGTQPGHESIMWTPRNLSYKERSGVSSELAMLAPTLLIVGLYQNTYVDGWLKLQIGSMFEMLEGMNQNGPAISRCMETVSSDKSRTCNQN